MRYFRLPFAVSGTRSAIPDTQPSNGAVNYSTGYSSVYQLDPTDPLALRVERAQMNENLYQITDTLKNYYENCVPPFITSADNGGTPFPYSKDSLVKLGGVVYSSNVNSNTTTPPGASWTVVDMAIFNAKAPTASPAFTGTPTAPTAAASTATPQIASTAFVRAAMALFGVGTGTAANAANLNTIVNGGIYSYLPGATNNPGTDSGSVFHVPHNNSGGAFQVAIEYGTNAMYMRRQASGVWNSWQRVWNEINSEVIVDAGSNSNGYFEVYSNRCVRIYRTVSYTAGSGTLYALPVSIASSSGASGYAQMLGTTAPAAPMAMSITASGFTLDGPSSTVVVGITFPAGA